MLSMSAFGIGNAWSDTRAYGSTLEQGAGVPRFAGFPGTTPTMYHLAYGDPIGGLFGCAAMLTALLEKRVSGRGQLVNLSMVETMLQFTTPALLQHRIDPAVEVRRGNRHPVHAPHGFFRVDGQDQWIAVSVADGMSVAALGTDTGGSVRIPSAFCGMAGLKTTYGRISTVGVWPLAPSFFIVLLYLDVPSSRNVSKTPAGTSTCSCRTTLKLKLCSAVRRSVSTTPTADHAFPTCKGKSYCGCLGFQVRTTLPSRVRRSNLSWTHRRRSRLP